MLTTPNFGLKKIQLKDSPPNIEVINPNWDIIDTEMKKIGELQKQQDDLKVCSANMKNFTDFNKLSVIDDTTEWEKEGTGAITLRKGVTIEGVGNDLTVVNIFNSQSTETLIGSGAVKTYKILAKPNTEYTLTALLNTGTIEGSGATMQIIERASDGSQIQYKSLPWINTETSFSRYILKIKTGLNAKSIQIRFIVNGKGSMNVYQPKLAEGNKATEGWTPSYADIDREIQAVKTWSENLKHGIRNIVSNTSGEKVVDDNAEFYPLTVPGVDYRGKECVLVFDAKTSNGTDNFYVSLSEKGSSKQFLLPQTTTAPTTFKKFIVKLTMPSSTDINVDALLFVNKKSTMPQNTGTLTVKNIIIVEGNTVPIDWVPAPEDMKNDFVGVRNLISNGDFTKGLKHWAINGAGTIAKVELDPAGFSYLETSKHNVSNSKIRFDMIKKDDYVTVTFKARQKGTDTFTPSFYITNPNSTIVLNSKTSFVLNSTWTQYSFTFVAINNGDPTNSIYFYGSTNDSLLMHLTDIKIELGTHSTGFIPSTEDINEVIDLKQNGGDIGRLKIMKEGDNADVVKSTTPSLSFQNQNSKGIVIEDNSLRPNSIGLETMRLGTATMPWSRLYAKEVVLNDTLTLGVPTGNVTENIITTKQNFQIKGADNKGVVCTPVSFHPSTSYHDLGTVANSWGKFYTQDVIVGGTAYLRNTSETADGVGTTKETFRMLAANGNGVTLGRTAFYPLVPLHNLGTMANPWGEIIGGRLSISQTTLEQITSKEDLLSTKAAMFSFHSGDGTPTKSGVVIDSYLQALRPYTSSARNLSLGTPSLRFKELWIGDYGSGGIDQGVEPLPNGKIKMWGTTTINLPYGGTASKQLTFPLAFPNKCETVFANADFDMAGNSTAALPSINAYGSVNCSSEFENKSGCRIGLGHISSISGTGWGTGSASRDIKVTWIAYGQ
jgi:hypothetical protein